MWVGYVEFLNGIVKRSFVGKSLCWLFVGFICFVFKNEFVKILIGELMFFDVDIGLSFRENRFIWVYVFDGFFMFFLGKKIN